MDKQIQSAELSGFNEQLLDDAPITLLKEDKFGREQFIKNLASVLIPSSAETEIKSKVITLTGTWGVGKTSVINMVRMMLRQEDQKLYIIDFNPWQYTKKDDLIKPFLEEFFLGCKKGKIKLFFLRRKISKYYKNLDFGSVKKYLFDLVTAIGSFVGFIALLKRSTEKVNSICIPVINDRKLIDNFVIIQTALYLIPICIFCFLFILSIAKFIKTWLKNEIESKRISQLKQKEDISTYIKKNNMHFLIIIDDIDRLTPDETLQIFRIIRTNADFENTTYLLSFDKNIVIENLKSMNIDGEGFIEKIITMEYVLPKPPAFYIRKYIDEGLKEISKQKTSDELLDLENGNFKYNEIIKLLAETLTTMRDIKRFLNSLSLHVNVLISDNILEINFIDLAVLECIMLKYRDCYYGIQHNKILLINTEEEHKKESITVETIKNTIKNFAKTDIELKLVLWLFPTVYYAFKDEFDLVVVDYKPEYAYYSHICSPNYFDIYFSTGINMDDPEHISNKEISEFIGVSFDKNKMVELLKKWLQTDKFLLFIDILRDICQADSFIPKDNAAFIAAMFDAQCIVPYEQKKFFATNMRDRCKEIVSSYLKRFHKKTKDIIIKAINASRFAYPAAAFFFNQKKLCKQQHIDALFREEDIWDIRKAVLDKLITYKQESGDQFWKDDDVEDILGFWHTLDSENFNKEMNAKIETDEQLCELMINLYKRRLRRDICYFPYITMKYFGDLDMFKQRLQNAVNNSQLSKRHLIIAKYFIKNFRFCDDFYQGQLEDKNLEQFDAERNNELYGI